MKPEDLKDNLDEALLVSNVPDKNRPKLLSDTVSCYISHELSEYLKDKDMKLKKTKLVTNYVK
tara:strand:+ start:86 stop:274 length:189 start_codon:yes stop_codon:yes gene_type:complete